MRDSEKSQGPYDMFYYHKRIMPGSFKRYGGQKMKKIFMGLCCFLFVTQCASDPAFWQAYQTSMHQQQRQNNYVKPVTCYTDKMPYTDDYVTRCY